MQSRTTGFEEFAASNFAALCRTGYLVCGDWQRAEDAAQETLIRLYQRWGRLGDVAALEGYARRTLVNLLIDESRKPARRERTEERPPESFMTSGTAAVEDRDEAMRVLAQLPPRQRACVVLRFYLDLSVRDTAELLDCSTGNVTRLTSDALASIHRNLEGSQS